MRLLCLFDGEFDVTACNWDLLTSCCYLQILYETASSCLVGRVDKKGRPYKNVMCQCRKTSLRPMCSAEFPDLLYYKYQRALVPPGEAVGMLAAQVDITCGFIWMVREEFYMYRDIVLTAKFTLIYGSMILWYACDWVAIGSEWMHAETESW